MLIQILIIAANSKIHNKINNSNLTKLINSKINFNRMKEKIYPICMKDLQLHNNNCFKHKLTKLVKNPNRMKDLLLPNNNNNKIFKDKMEVQLHNNNFFKHKITKLVNNPNTMKDLQLHNNNCFKHQITKLVKDPNSMEETQLHNYKIKVKVKTIKELLQETLIV